MASHFMQRFLRPSLPIKIALRGDSAARRADSKKMRFARFGIFLRASAATCWRKPSSIAIISAMKSKHSFARNVLLMLVFGCAIFISTIAQGGPPGYLRSNHHFPPGRLTIDRAANFGWNLGFHLQIDGRPVGSVVQGRSYSTWLSPGPHVLTVHKVPATGFVEPTSITVNIQPGAEHLYQAVWDSNLVDLQPAGYCADAGRVLAK